eukprot:scpid80297/ scgid12875/ 
MSGVGSVAMSAGVVCCAKNSKLFVAKEVDEGDKLRIHVELYDKKGDRLDADKKLLDSVQVEMTHQSGSYKFAWDFEAEYPRNKRLGTFEIDKQQGKVFVTAQINKINFDGSPATANIVDPMSTKFDPGLCHKYLSISDHSYNRTVVHVRERGMQKGEPSCASVYGTKELSQGKHKIAIKIDQLGSLGRWSGSHNCVIGFANQERPDLGGERSKFAWISDGDDLGRPWKAGDEIILSLDCEEHTLDGHHCQTGVTATKKDVKGDLYLYITTWAYGDKFTIQIL